MLATQGTLWPPHQLIPNMLCVQRLDFQYLKNAVRGVCWDSRVSWDVTHPTAPPEGQGTQPTTDWPMEGGGGSGKHCWCQHQSIPISSWGTGLPSQFLCSALGRKCAVQEAFPTALRWAPFHEGSLSTGKSTMETEQVLPSHPLLQTSPEKAHFSGRELQIYLGQVHTGASNIGQHFAFSFFWLLAFLSGKQEMPRFVSCFFFFFWFFFSSKKHLKTI